MIVPGIQQQMHQQAAMLLNSNAANAGNIILHWRERTYPPGYNKNDESSGTITAVARTLEFRAMIHQVDHRMTGYQRFMELGTGSVILDYMADLDLETKEDPRIEINGSFYVQKSIGKELLEMWNTTNSEFGGLFKTIAIIPAE